MAEPFAFANDSFPFGLTLLVELVDILDGSPMCDVPRLAFPEEAIQHAALQASNPFPYLRRKWAQSLHRLMETMRRCRIVSIVSSADLGVQKLHTQMEDDDHPGRVGSISRGSTQDSDFP